MTDGSLFQDSRDRRTATLAPCLAVSGLALWPFFLHSSPSVQEAAFIRPPDIRFLSQGQFSDELLTFHRLAYRIRYCNKGAFGYSTFKNIGRAPPPPAVPSTSC